MTAYIKESRQNTFTPLHIALVTETWPPEINGVANSVFQLAKGLVAQGHTITLIRPKRDELSRQHNVVDSPEHEEILVTGYKIPHYPDMRFASFNYRKLKHEFSRIQPDIVHIVTEGPLGMGALKAARKNGIAVSSGYHTQFHDFSDHFNVNVLVSPILSYLKYFHNKCDVTCVPSEKSRKELGTEGVKRLHIVGRGVDTTRFNPKHRSVSLRKSWGASEHTTVLMYVGRVSPEKNIDLTIAGYRELQLQQPNRDVKLVVVGDGPDRERLERLAPDVIFTGAKVAEELSQHYASGDCFVFASEVETFGNVVTEAMASGLAVVAYDDAAAGRFVDKACGWKLPVGDEAAFTNTVGALPSQSVLLNMGQAANQKVANLGWETPVAQFNHAFQAALARHNAKVGWLERVLA